ncbi:MAG TPA: hypothetical protein VKR61_05275 [Bryobacteraceae bacterium]|nr:hypothetical protein [Bryobacteraceae bacterium]
MQERHQFTKLARNFLARFFESDLLSPQADFRATLSQALGLLATPGLLLPLLMMPLLMMDPNAARSPSGKLIFVFLSMLVMGVLSVLEWDALMLDHRDQSILMSLPLRPRTIFAAKFWALAQFILIFSVDVNAGSILMLPPLEMVGLSKAGFLTLARYAIAHAAGTIGAGSFMFLLVVSAQATLINVFSPRWFRRISTVVQVTAILTLLIALFFFPAVLEQMTFWKQHNSAIFRWFPAMWYVGICEVLQGTADVQFQSAAHIGLYALVVTGGCAVAAYAVSYGRYTRSSMEIPAKITPRRGEKRSVSDILVRRLAPNPLERATLRFTLLTMRQSPTHRLILAAYVGTGLAIVLEEIVSLSFRSGAEWRQARQMALLSLPLVISFFLLSGMRFVFNIPSELAANWVFQMAERGEKSAYVSGVRKVMSMVVVAPLGLLILPVYAVLAGAGTAIVHAIYCALLSLILIEALLWRMNKVPFACSYSPGRFPVVALLCGYWLAFMAYTDLMVLAETYFLHSGVASAISLSVLAGLLWGLMAYRKRPHGETTALEFYEEPDPVVRTLDLTV